LKTKRNKLKDWANKHRDSIAITVMYVGIFTVIGGPIIWAAKQEADRRREETERWKHGFVLHKLEECDGIFIAPALPPG
jgi:hypothetical protein